MRQISSRRTFLYKKILPVIIFGICAVVVSVIIGAKLSGEQELPWNIGDVIPLVLGFGWFLLMRRFISNLADQVDDDGDVLVVRKNGQEDKIPRYSPATPQRPNALKNIGTEFSNAVVRGKTGCFCGTKRENA